VLISSHKCANGDANSITQLIEQYNRQFTCNKAATKHQQPTATTSSCRRQRRSNSRRHCPRTFRRPAMYVRQSAVTRPIPPPSARVHTKRSVLSLERSRIRCCFPFSRSPDAAPIRRRRWSDCRLQLDGDGVFYLSVNSSVCVVRPCRRSSREHRSRYLSVDDVSCVTAMRSLGPSTDRPTDRPSETEMAERYVTRR
jgi:hypothetical protein